MRVGLLADRLDRGERRTGVGAYVDGLANGLSELDGADRFVLFAPGEMRGPADSCATAVQRQPTWRRRSTTLAWTFLRRPRLRGAAGPLDVLHILVPTVPVPTDLPTVATIHDLMPLKHPHMFRRGQRLLFAQAIRRIRRDARWIIAVSEATRADVVHLLDYPEERTSVIHHGVPRHFSKAPPEGRRDARARFGLGDDPFVLFVGELAERKNVPRLVDAFARARTTVPRARLVLVGSPGIGYAELELRIRRSGLDHRVTVAGHVSQSEVEGLMGAASAVVLPSLGEGFGFPVLEAMSVGTPVIASDAASLPEVVGDAGVIVPGTDTNALAEAIWRLLTDDELRERLSHAGEERAATFTWRRAAEQTLEAYGNALCA